MSNIYLQGLRETAFAYNVCGLWFLLLQKNTWQKKWKSKGLFWLVVVSECFVHLAHMLGQNFSITVISDILSQ